MIAGAINGLIVTRLRVNPTIATLGTLAPSRYCFPARRTAKPIGVMTAPSFTYLAQGVFWRDLAIPAMAGSKWTGIPVLTVIFVAVCIFVHILMRYTDFGAPFIALAATPRRPPGRHQRESHAGLDVRHFRRRCGLAGVLLAARTTSGNPNNACWLELRQSPRCIGRTATSGGKGTVFGTFLAVILVGVLNKMA